MEERAHFIAVAEVYFLVLVLAVLVQERRAACSSRHRMW